LCCCSSATAGIAIGTNFKIYLLSQFCSNRLKFFLQYTGDTDAKNDGPEMYSVHAHCRCTVYTAWWQQLHVCMVPTFFQCNNKFSHHHCQLSSLTEHSTISSQQLLQQLTVRHASWWLSDLTSSRIVFNYVIQGRPHGFFQSPVCVATVKAFPASALSSTCGKDAVLGPSRREEVQTSDSCPWFTYTQCTTCTGLHRKKTEWRWTQFNREHTSDYSILLLYADVKYYRLLSTLYSYLLCFLFHPETHYVQVHMCTTIDPAFY